MSSSFQWTIPKALGLWKSGVQNMLGDSTEMAPSEAFPGHLQLTNSSQYFLIAKVREERGWHWAPHSQTLQGECHASGWWLGKVISLCLISLAFLSFFSLETVSHM